MKRRQGFTLLELIVVIIIVGVLATLGFVQYAAVIEKGRRAEAAIILSSMRSAALVWNQEGHAASTYPNTTDLGSLLGTALPTAACASTHYFVYTMASATGQGTATRCTASGKPPQGANADILTLSTTGAKGSTPADLW